MPARLRNERPNERSLLEEVVVIGGGMRIRVFGNQSGSAASHASAVGFTARAARRLLITVTILGIVALTCGAGFALVQRAGATPYDVCATGCPYVSINDAIAAASTGATITVGPGTYGPNEVGATTPDTKITINKAITLQGAGPGASIINDAPANQGTATAGVITITTPSTPGNITVSGFTIEGAIVNDSNDDGILMNINVTNASDMVTVDNNQFYGDSTLDPQLLFDQTDAIVEQNTTSTLNVSNNTFQGVFRAALIEDDPGAFNFTNNDVNLHPIYDPSVSGQLDNWAEGIWFLADNGQAMFAPANIAGNTFENYIGLAVGLNGGYHATYYKGSVSNVTIDSNNFLDTGVMATYSNPQVSSAVLLHGWEPTNGDSNSTVSNVAITNNMFTPASGSSNGNEIGILGSVTGGISIDGNTLQGVGTQPPAGINFTTVYSNTAVSITNNVIRGFVNGASADTLPNGASVSAAQNCIDGNSSYGFSAAGGSVNAQHNWWGSAQGPGTGVGFGNPVTTSTVDASHFLTSAPQATCQGPITSNVQSSVSPLPVNTAYTLTATEDTTSTSDAPIAAAYYTLDGGAPQPMTAATGTFGSSKTMNVTSGSLTGFSATGTHQLCVFGVDTFHQTGDPICLTLQVIIPTSNTTTTVTSSANPSVANQSVTFTITVVATSGIPTGTVALADNGAPLAGPLTLNGAGVATYTTSALGVGTHPLVASYAGDSSGNPIYAPSTSATLKQVVNLISTTTSVSASPTPAVSGQTVTLSVSVHAADGSTPSGTVTLSDGATSLGTVTLTNGTGSLATSALSVGTHHISAAYSGDTTHDVSTGTGTATVDATPPVPTGSSNAYIRIVQSSEAYATSDISIDGAVTFPNVAACTAQPYYPISAGTHSFTVQAPSGGATVITQALTLVAGHYYTLAVVGNSAKAVTPALIVYQDDTSVTPNQAKVRVYHLSDTLGSVEVKSGATVVQASLAYQQATGYTTQSAGTVTYTFQPAGSGTTALSDTLTVAANQVYSIFLLCNAQVTTAAATGTPTSLPQTGNGPTALLTPQVIRVLELVGALLLLAGVVGLGVYLVLTRRRGMAL